MRAQYRERAVGVCQMHSQDQHGEERECFQKICCRLIDAIRHDAQRGHRFVSVTRRPAITVLKADEMRGGDQLQETKNDAGRQKTQLSCHNVIDRIATEPKSITVYFVTSPRTSLSIASKSQ